MDIKGEYLLPFFLPTFISIPIIFLLFTKLSSTKKKNHHLLLPPGPNGFPIIGNLHAIGGRPHESLAMLAKTYGPLMTVKLGFTTTVVASSADMAREILVKNDQAFLGRPVPDAVTALRDHEMTLAWIPGAQQWMKLRKLWKNDLFTTHRLDAFRDLRHELMKNVIQTVAEAKETGEAIVIVKLVFVTTLSLLSTMMFSDNILDPKSPDMDEFQALVARVMELSAKPNLADVFPFLRPFDPQGIKKMIKVSYDRLGEMVEMCIDNRRNKRASKADRVGDFLDVLLDFNELPAPQGIDRRDVRLLLMEMLVAGMDTSSATTEWAMTEVLHNPQVMAKAKKELSQAFGPKGFANEQEVMQLPYLDAILKETLRLHPTSPLLLPHKAQKDVQISNYLIPKNTRVLVNFWSISRDSAYWENPNRFQPERFLCSDYDYRGKNLTFIPFGAGRRHCPGLPLATRMVKLLLATFVHNFDWKLPNGMAPEDMDMSDKFGLTLQKAQPLLAIPVDISDQ
uniref:CYP3 n=1 Tax=Gentiana crassa subsp. rigescens TaxID=3097545 RepID=A0A2Z0N1Z8_9GENT|nr:CYP3 [Gentiana rigescens]